MARSRLELGLVNPAMFWRVLSTFTLEKFWLESVASKSPRMHTGCIEMSLFETVILRP